MTKKPNPDLVKYIEKHLAKGFDIKHVKKRLAEVGHPIEAIEDAAAYVLSNRPGGKKSPKKFMVVYGLVLILVIGGFAWFVWYKATQQLEYKETVTEIKKNQTYLGLTDVQLIKLAEGGDAKACSFINNHNLYYICLAKEWKSDDCVYERYIGSGDACYLKKALDNSDISACYNITDLTNMHYCLNLSISQALESGNKYLCKGDGRCLDAFFEKYPDTDYCKLNAINSDECFIKLGTLKQDASACDLISENNTEAKLACLLGAIDSLDGIVPYCESYYVLFSRNIIATLENSTDNQKATCYIHALNYFNRVRGLDCDYVKTFINANDKIQSHLADMKIIRDLTEPGDIARCLLT